MKYGSAEICRVGDDIIRLLAKEGMTVKQAKQAMDWAYDDIKDDSIVFPPLEERPEYIDDED